jgi:hypothetical protein
MLTPRIPLNTAEYRSLCIWHRSIEEKKREVDILKSEIPPGAKLLMRERGSAGFGSGSPTQEILAGAGVGGVGVGGVGVGVVGGEGSLDLGAEEEVPKDEGELKVENYYLLYL